MKNLRKISAIFIALAMVLSVISSLSGVRVKAANTAPEKTSIVIHKIVMQQTDFDSHNDASKTPKYNGDELNISNYFGGNSKEVAGVEFEVYKRVDTKGTGQGGIDDLEPGNEKFKRGTQSQTITEDTGKFFTLLGTYTTKTGGVEVPDLEKGVYMIVEKDAKKIKSSKAIPARIVLPMIAEDGNYFDNASKKLHIYPKNVEEKPVIDKTVGDLENKYLSAGVGTKITWYLQATVPYDVKGYKTFVMKDIFEPGLTVDDGNGAARGNVVVKHGTGTNFNDNNAYKELTKNTDYVLGGTGQEVIITFTETGIKKLAAGDNVVASIDTFINKKAVMGADIPNNFTLKYGHEPNSNKEPNEIPENKRPKVVTGGKKFMKVIEGTETALEDAVFELHDDSTVVNWTDALIAANKEAIDAGKFAIKNGSAYEATSATKQPTDGQPIYLRSIADGTFEIKGLEFSSWKKQKWNGTAMVDGDQKTHKWNLVEVKAPTDYAINTTPVDFTVDKTSYFKDPTIAGPVAQDPLKVNNKKVTIPQTGGIGTVIFAVVGLGLMGFAAYAMKRNSKED